MRWEPNAGHIPRGFCGATSRLEDVQLVLVVAEPGNPQPDEHHAASPNEAFQSAYDFAYASFRDGRDLFHRNIRHILDLCWPGDDFDAHMRRTWITESVLCSARTEGGNVPKAIGMACRALYLEKQLELVPNAVVAALGSKAANRLAGLTIVSAFAVAPPGCNFNGARESWQAIADEVRRRAA